MTGAPPLLEVRDLHVQYKQDRRTPPLRAVDGVSFAVGMRETLGIVGESGSGKSTIGRAILGLAPIHSGHVLLDGRDITSLGYTGRRSLSTELQVVFQDPYSSLNPARTVGQSIDEMLRPHGIRDKKAARERTTAILERVGLSAEAGDRFPSSFSGGQRQRIAIARALMASPRLVICDEPVSALDLSVQAQVLNLLRRVQEELGISYVFVSHDLAVVRHISHHIVVLYKGRVMESGDAQTIYERPLHPYTKLLIAAEPVPDPDRQRLRHKGLPHVTNSAATPEPNACPFAPRCPLATQICWAKQPALQPTVHGLVACHHWSEFAQSWSPRGNPADSPRQTPSTNDHDS
jgi:oligopeptide/dipeptide ABC transporter ATP-binding protein